MPFSKHLKVAPWNEAREAIAGCDGTIRNHSVRLEKLRTTIRLDNCTWAILREVARREKIKISELCSRIYKSKPEKLNFTCTIRRYLLLYYRDAATGKRKLKKLP